MVLIPIPIGRRYTATVSGSAWKFSCCTYCGTKFCYQVYVVARASAPSPLWLNNEGAAASAQARAADGLEQALDAGFEARACPTCGRYQRWMLDRVKESLAAWVYLAVAFCVLAAVVLLIAAGYVRHNGTGGEWQFKAALAFVAAAFVLPHGRHWVLRGYDPNTSEAVGWRQRALSKQYAKSGREYLVQAPDGSFRVVGAEGAPSGIPIVAAFSEKLTGRSRSRERVAAGLTTWLIVVILGWAGTGFYNEQHAAHQKKMAVFATAQRQASRACQLLLEGELEQSRKLMGQAGSVDYTEALEGFTVESESMKTWVSRWRNQYGTVLIQKGPIIMEKLASKPLQLQDILRPFPLTDQPDAQKAWEAIRQAALARFLDQIYLVEYRFEDIDASIGSGFTVKFRGAERLEAEWGSKVLEVLKERCGNFYLLPPAMLSEQERERTRGTVRMVIGFRLTNYKGNIRIVHALNADVEMVHRKGQSNWNNLPTIRLHEEPPGELRLPGVPPPGSDATGSQERLLRRLLTELEKLPLLEKVDG